MSTVIAGVDLGALLAETPAEREALAREMLLWAYKETPGMPADYEQVRRIMCAVLHLDISSWIFQEACVYAEDLLDVAEGADYRSKYGDLTPEHDRLYWTDYLEDMLSASVSDILGTV